MKKKALKIVLVSLGILVVTLSIVIILAVSSFRILDKESDFYYYEYEDSDGSMVGVLDINFPSFVGGHIEDFLRNCIKEIVIPEEIDGETVRACGLFSSCENLKSVIIPEGVTSINREAFGNCSSLESIRIPDSVTIIEDYAFGDCSGLENIEIPVGVTRIGEGAFVCCSSLKDILIPNSVEELGKDVFSQCYVLETITFCGDVEIGENAFSECYELETITFCGDVSSSKSLEALSAIEKNVTFVVPDGSNVGNWALENGYNVERYVSGELFGSPKSDEYYGD